MIKTCTSCGGEVFLFDICIECFQKQRTAEINKEQPDADSSIVWVAADEENGHIHFHRETIATTREKCRQQSHTDNTTRIIKARLVKLEEES